MSSINARVPPSRIAAIDSPADGEVAAYQASSGQFEWVANGGAGTIGGSSTANQISFGDTTANEITSSGNLQFLSGQNLYVGGRVQIGNATGTKLTTVTAQDLILDTNEGTDSGNITIVAGANGQISITPDGTGLVKIDGVGINNSAIATGYILKATSATEAGWVAESASGIAGSIANTQVAVGSGTDTISGSSALTLNASVLTVENQIELSSTGAAGILKNSQSNQDLRLQVSGTGNVRIENQTTNTASQLNVKGNGTGTPQISLSNDSKAITIKCDENQKLKIEGDTSNFIFDASSATGGIQFPDGTVQITAASGGDNGYDVILPDPTLMTAGVGSSRFAKIPACTFLIGGGAGSTEGISTTTAIYPFIANHTGNLASISIEVSTAGAATTQDIGIYSVDSDGYPNSLIGKANFDVSSTGIVTQTTLSATISLTKGEMYYMGWSRATGAAYASLQCVQDNATAVTDLHLA